MRHHNEKLYKGEYFVLEDTIYKRSNRLTYIDPKSNLQYEFLLKKEDLVQMRNELNEMIEAIEEDTDG